MNDIKCPSCGTLFGREKRPGVLDMKYREVFRRVTGGRVEGPCRKCGEPVVWPQEPLTVEK